MNLVRKKSADKVARYRRREAARQETELRQLLEVWTASIQEAFADARPTIPHELDDRGQDIAEPLLALADLAGTSGPRRRAQLSSRSGVERSRTTLSGCSCSQTSEPCGRKTRSG